MSSLKDLRFEGYTAEEILALPSDEFDAYVFCGEPLVIDVGTSNVLGEFSIEERTLVLELAQIDGGGEGVLLGLTLLANRVAESRGLTHIEWRVHAVHCAEPNLKLRRVLNRRGFEVRVLEGTGEVYHKTVPAPHSEHNQSLQQTLDPAAVSADAESSSASSAAEPRR
ncbi:MAG: hypothetical protein AAF545_14740 [Pseudomonadota bacterium]